MNIRETDHDYCNETIQIYRHGVICIAERLWLIFSGERWRGTWSSWDEFLKDLGIGKGTASKLCSLYQRIVIELGFPVETLHAAPWTKLYTALPMMIDKDAAERAIQGADLLAESDILAERYEHKHGKECSHERSHALLYCRDCKRYIKVHEKKVVSSTTSD